MTVLVTGATGAIATAVIDRLSRAGDESVVGTVRAERPGDGHVRCDLAVRSEVEALVARVRPRLVLHLAGSFRNDFALDAPVNALSAGWLLEAAASAGLDTRVLVVGSAAEYGMVEPGQNPVPESCPLRPVSVYGLTKAMQTEIACCFARARGADVAVARLFNVIGPGLSERLFVGRAERLIARYRRGEIDRLEFGGLQSERDYLGMDETVDALLRVALRAARGEVVNVGSGRPVRMRALLDRMLQEAGCPDAPVDERPASQPPRFDVPCIYADVSRLQALSRGAGDPVAGASD